MIKDLNTWLIKARVVHRLHPAQTEILLKELKTEGFVELLHQLPKEISVKAVHSNCEGRKLHPPRNFSETNEATRIRCASFHEVLNGLINGSRSRDKLTLAAEEVQSSTERV